MSPTPEHPTRLLLGVSLAQGLCLYLLYTSVEAQRWPSKAPVYSYPLWTLAVLAPLLLLLSATRANLVATAKNTAAFCAVLTLLAVYTGWQARPFGQFPVGSLTFAYMVTVSIASFKALMYLQQRADGAALSYPALFTHSWRNFLTGVFAAVFTLIFWLILLLWGELFLVIGIDFFDELFEKDWFIIPAASVAFGIGVLLLRKLTRIIDNITVLLRNLTKLLLPLVLGVAVIFLAALAFTGLNLLWDAGNGTGLDLLWDTGNGTALLLWLLALTLFFINAVYQDGRGAAPYPLALHRLVYLAVCATPALSGLACYGLLLRIQQYGWSVERCWAVVAWLVLSLFSLGYVLSIARRRDAWTHDLARVNVAMGLVVLGIALAANTPLLDFRKISLASQQGRVDSGEIELADFDFWYARHHLARPAYLSMQAIKAEIGDSDPGLLAAIEDPQRRTAEPESIDADELWQRMVYRPARFDLPVDLRRLITESNTQFRFEFEPVLIATDLNEDGASEYVLLIIEPGAERLWSARFYHRVEGRWQKSSLAYLRSDKDALTAQLREGEIALRDPEYKDLSVGGVILRPRIDN